MSSFDRFPSLQSSQVRYEATFALVAAATAASYYSGDVLKLPCLVPFAGAVGVITLLGRGPAIAGIIAATLATDFFFLPPVFSFTFSRFTGVVALYYLAIVLAMLAGIGWLTRKGWDQKLKLLLYSSHDRSLPLRTVEGESDSRLLGRLDGSLDGEIFGWALDTGQSAVSPTLSVYAEHRLVGEVHAIHYRPDVGSHCFYFDLMRLDGLNPESRVDVKFATGRPLPNSPLILSLPRVRPARHTQAVLFMHIAKTAGTAFREAIIENYRKSEVLCVYPDPPGILETDLGLLPLDQRSALRLIVGHFQYGVHRCLPQNWTYVAIVRDPVTRVISQYRYEMAKQGNEDPGRDSPAHLVELLERGESVTLDNHMVRCFSGVSEKECAPGQVSHDIYQLAVCNLKSSFCFIGHQEQSAQAYARLQEMFGWKRQRSLGRINQGSGSIEAYTSIRRTIVRFNRWDVLLHAEILKSFP